MYLRSLIYSYFDNKSLSIYDKHGEKVDIKTIDNELFLFKKYILSNYSENDVVGIKLDKDYRYFIFILACMDLGITYVPLNDDWPKSRVEQIRIIANIKNIVDTNVINNIIKQNDTKNLETSRYFDITPDKALYIIFTSGSTGEPKGVVIKRESVESFFRWVDGYFGKITNDDKLLQIADFSFDMSVLDIGLALTKKLEIYFSTFNESIFDLAYEIDRLNISLVSTVPNNINMLLSRGVAKRVNLESLKNIFIGGARFSYGLYKKILKSQNVEVYNFYGPTECTVYAFVKKITRDENLDIYDQNVSIGKAIDGIYSIVLDDSFNKSDKGELYIGGIQTMSEYISSPIKTSDALKDIDGKLFYKTDDIAFVDKKGDFYIVGRVDDTIKRKGFRVNLQDIDSYIQKLDDVVESASIAIEDAISENIVVTFISTSSNINEIKEELNSILIHSQIPDELVIIDKFPSNSSGKICKKTLKEDYLKRKTNG